MRLLASGAVCATAFMAASLGTAEIQPAPPAADGQPDIIVEGRTAEAVERFVGELTQTERGKQIARWNGRICPKVLGVSAPQASYVVNRIVAVARSVNISVGSGNCRGNIIIVLTDDADNFARILVKKYPRLFKDSQDSLATSAEIDRLIRPRPVRWIAASTTVGASGMPITEQNRIYSASRLALSTRENARFSFVIVDGGRLEGIVWSQLTDYLAMVTLARPTMDSGYDAHTILSVFEMRDRGAKGPRRLTVQDRALLRGLYSTNPTVSAQAQRSSIRLQMDRDANAPKVD
jgi:hypothetical protein